MNNKQNLILLCDYGLDDAAATVHILDNREKFNRIFILPIGGNMPRSVSHDNALRLLFNYGDDLDNVTVVDTSAIPQPKEILSDIHGKDGMGDILPEKYIPTVPVINFDDWFGSLGTDCIIASVGPCTVTARILEKTGAVPLIIMGGNISEPPNYNGLEFNHAMDVGAFAECVKYPHIIGTLDSCHHPMCDFYNIDCSGDKLLNRLCRRSAELAAQRNEKGAYIYDLITIRYLFVPERFEVIKQKDKDGNILSVLKYVSEEKIIKLN